MTEQVHIKSKTINNSRKSQSKYNGLIIGAVIIAAIVFAGVAWYNSDAWPWPSDERIRERLDTIISVCSNNENSKKCKELQNRYNATFMYCKSIADMSDFSIFHPMPWYGVAWEGKTSTPPDTYAGYGEHALKMPTQYYGCQPHLDE